jgi:hypothetical protein
MFPPQFTTLFVVVERVGEIEIRTGSDEVDVVAAEMVSGLPTTLTP